MKSMKKITVKYTIEIPEDKMEKVCSKAKIGRNTFTIDIKHMAEISGRHRVHEFMDGFINSTNHLKEIE